MKVEQEATQFNLFVNKLRIKRHCTMKQVCEGLCASQEIFFLENGKRLPNRQLQDAIVERLGIGAEDYEHMYNHVEYDRWKVRQRILHNITFGRIEQAGKLLEEYYVGYGKNSDGSSSIEAKLERQFYLSMLAQIKRCNGASREELYSLFDEAIHLTVPALGQRDMAKLILSIKELNLLLEAEHYRKEGERIERYREITAYIEEAGLDDCGMAKIYPKAVFFLCRCLMAIDKGKRLTISDMLELLRTCNRALEILRNSHRMYFLWELLDMRGQLLEYMSKCFQSQGEQGKADSISAMYQENAEWKKILEQVYKEFQVPKETFEYCYLYVMKGVSCINDVIRIRRQMLGMKPGELCDGICDRKTLRRLERRETTPHKEIVERLFERLGLSGEFTRTELITDDPEARKLMGKLRKYENDQQWEAAEKILNKIKARVSPDIRHNKQALMRRLVFLHWEKGELENDEYCRQMRGILEWTIPFEAFLKEGEKYLTYEEQICIRNIVQGLEGDGEIVRTCLKRFEDIYLPILDNELQEVFAGVFELIMSFVGSELGNRGKYDRSDRYSEAIAQGCLRLRRMGALSDSLYNRWWNYMERKHKGISSGGFLDEEEELRKCIIFSRLNKQKNDEIFFRKKLERLKAAK